MITVRVRALLASKLPSTELASTTM